MISPCFEVVNPRATPPSGWMLVDPDTGQRVEAALLSLLAQTWGAHRRDHDLPVEKLSLKADAQSLVCRRIMALPGGASLCVPCGESLPPSPSAVEAIRFQPHNEEDANLPMGRNAGAGPQQWAWLSREALKGGLTEDDLARFTQRISCSICRSHWRRLLKQYPPQLSNSETMFGWVQLMHNAVNQQLGRREWSLEEARARWS